MIKKVSKLKHFGIFHDFKWDNNTPEFSRFNLLYGWNKSGKTTFSRAFAACEKQTTEFIQYPKGGEFDIKTENDISINQFNCHNGVIQIKVFNKDFIEENVSFDPNNPSKPIVYVSAEDIGKNKKLKELREKEQFLLQKKALAKKDSEKSERAEDDFRKLTARNIKDIVGNLKINDKYRDYDKGSIKTTIEKNDIEHFAKLSNEDVEKKKKFISGNPLKNQVAFLKDSFSFPYAGQNLTTFSAVSIKLSNILKRKVIAETVERFTTDSELNKWAQHGFKLHKIKQEKSRCLFCQNKFPSGFFDILSKHFSNDYEKIQHEINDFIEKLKHLKKETIEEKNQELYSVLQNQYTNAAIELNEIIIESNNWIDKAVEKLKEKHENPLSEIIIPDLGMDLNFLYDEKVEKLNAIIKEHNKKVNNYEQELKKIKKELEQHLIATAIEEHNYSTIKSEYKKNIEIEKEVQKELNENQREIDILEKETSNIDKAVQKINKHLEEFFGRKEILLELDDFKKGYVIKRDGTIAYNLSEGEKNAIAFSYFIVKTQEKGFNRKEAIIIIDDPISSFDSNFIYHCFSLIENHFKETKQLIISTHNFEFFNLVKNWFGQKNRKVESNNKKITKEANKKPIPCEFFMIENIISNDKRCASIIPLEKTLQKFKSEYHFLFSRLIQFITKDTPNYADFYTIGNIARRFLEIYVNFKIPTTGDLKSRVDQLDTQTVSEIEKGKVYKLIQEFSHGFDPASTIEHKDKSEIHNAIKVLMKMVEESDKKHFESLKSNL